VKHDDTTLKLSFAALCFAPKMFKKIVEMYDLNENVKSDPKVSDIANSSSDDDKLTVFKAGIDAFVGAMTSAFAGDGPTSTEAQPGAHAAAGIFCEQMSGFAFGEVGF